MKLNIMILLADGHVPLLHVGVGVRCRGDWISAGLLTWILLADQPLVLQQGASAGVVTAAGNAKMLPTLLTLPQGEVWSLFLSSSPFQFLLVVLCALLGSRFFNGVRRTLWTLT